MPLKLLIAEDSPDVAQVVAFGARLVWPDCEVTLAPNGAVALSLFACVQPDLVVLDIHMPLVDGFGVCEGIRAVSQVPILMLTVNDAIPEKVRAFELGADDYLTKPFDHRELLARLRALARRAHSSPPPSASFAVGEFSMNFAVREVCMAGTVIHLTTTEYRLLEELVRHAGTVVPHAILLNRVWGPGYTSENNYLKGVVLRLRTKLGDNPRQPRYLQSEWGIGYRFAAADRVSEAADLRTLAESD
jgi:two-component system KDP operon response regulator KdpE